MEQPILKHNPRMV